MSKLTENTITIENLLNKINALPNSSSGTDTSDATATSGDILSGKTAYANGEKITGNIATVTQPAPTVSVNSSGLITASYTPSKGYTGSTTAQSATKQLTTQAAKTITPTTSSQTAVASGVYTTGAITVAAIPSNYEDVTTETNDYTSELIALQAKISSLETILQGKAAGGSGGSVETCTVTVTNNDMFGLITDPLVTYTDGNMVINEITVQSTASLTVAKGTLIGVYYSETCIGNGSVTINKRNLQDDRMDMAYALAIANGNGSIIFA